MLPSEAKQKVEELTGRIDAVKGEMVKIKQEIDRFVSQNLLVETKEAQADYNRLQQRRVQLEQELAKYRRFW
ncbi:MAG: hypothetical protein WCV88_01940 [Patescibacteria group bacterium]